MGQNVSMELLADLQRHFAAGGAAREDDDTGVSAPPRPRIDISHGPLITLELAGIDEPPYRLAADGSSIDAEGVGAFAAVAGDGRAIVGYFTCPTINSELAELQAIRFGLRELGRERVEVFMDNQRIIETVRDLNEENLNRYTSRLGDRNGLRSILRSTRQLSIQAHRISTGDSGRGRLPTHRLMRVADRLSYAACRLASYEVPFDKATAEWLHRIGSDVDPGWREMVRRMCDRYIKRRVAAASDVAAENT